MMSGPRFTWRRHAALLTTILTAGIEPLRAQSAVAELAVANRTNANPTVAAEGAFVAVVWSAATVSSMDLFVAVSRDGGLTFAPPVQVNGVAGEARVSGENPARVALVPRKGREPELVVVWTARSGSTWKLQYARSTDGGRTYSAATSVPGSAAPGTRGWHSATVDGNGRVSVMWLDHRGLATADSGHRHGAARGATPATTATTSTAPPADPTARAGLSSVLVASLDGTSASTIATSPCYCCKTALASDGTTRYAAWRHVFPDGERDIAFAATVDGGRRFSAPIRLSTDHWKLDGCPDNGPALAVDKSHRVHAVWPTLESGGSKTDLSLFYALSRNGRSFGVRTRIPTRGPAGHVQVAIGRDGAPIVAWDEVVDGARRLGLARVVLGTDGRVSFAPLSVGDQAPGQWYPALTASPGGVIATWVRPHEGGSVIGVARIP